MKDLPNTIRTEADLEELLSQPTPAVVDLFARLSGDLLILGVGGKIGPSLSRMAVRACESAGVKKRIIGVSRFESDQTVSALEQIGIETIDGDLLDQQFLASLPKVENVIFMAGMKFGATENLALTWAINSYLPGLVAEKYRDARIVAFSTGCVYPLVPVSSGGSIETDPADPIGEYAQSCLGRERMFEYGSWKYQTPIALIRLNYAVELRYGVLVDIALRVKKRLPVDVTMGFANLIWQGDVNAMVLQALEICQSPAKILNLTGPETVSVRWAARKFAELFGTEAKLVGQEASTALLSNAALCHRLFGYPQVALEQMLLWITDWVANDQPVLNKPTHFEVRDGKY